MRAVVLRRFGSPDELHVEEWPTPVAGPGQALIEVAVASVVFVETQIRAGRGPAAASPPSLPFIPGNGVGGVIVAVGEGVDGALVGTRVVSTTGGHGGYAEVVAVEAAEVVPIPDALETTTAAALLADGRTAVALTRAAKPAAGEWVLVEAAGGGLGSLLVQLARNEGAHVVGAAGAPEKLQVAREVGAEVTVDYLAPHWEEQARDATGGGGFDLVYDGVGGEIGTAALGVVRDGGRFVVHGMASGSMTTPDEHAVTARRLQILGLGSLPAVSPRELSTMALDEAVEGRLRPTIGQTFPLEEAARAHAAIEARTAVGKTLLVPRRSGTVSRPGATL